MSDAEQSADSLAHAACVEGSAAMLGLGIAPLVGLLRMGHLGVQAARALGWSAEWISVGASVLATQVAAAKRDAERLAKPTESSGRAFRHGLYHAGARQPVRVESAEERDARERRQWSVPLDDLLAQRKAVA